MRLSIPGGAVTDGDPPLCATCRYSTIARGRTLREEVVFCSRMPFTERRVRFAVTSCSDYSDRRRPSLYQMEDIAWVLRSDPTRNKIGFVKADELDEDERHGRYE